MKRAKRKLSIQVRNADGSVVETIQRIPWAESFGNFNPIFCRYRGRRRLVQSDNPHLDDPFRSCEADHVNSLYILPRNNDGKLVPTWGHLDLEAK